MIPIFGLWFLSSNDNLIIQRKEAAVSLSNDPLKTGNSQINKDFD